MLQLPILRASVSLSRGMLELVRDRIEYAYRGVIAEYVTFNLAGHSNPRIAQIYDRRRRRVTRNIVERISI
jgi:hypothetical protein